MFSVINLVASKLGFKWWLWQRPFQDLYVALCFVVHSLCGGSDDGMKSQPASPFLGPTWASKAFVSEGCSDSAFYLYRMNLEIVTLFCWIGIFCFSISRAFLKEFSSLLSSLFLIISFHNFYEMCLMTHSLVLSSFCIWCGRMKSLRNRKWSEK